MCREKINREIAKAERKHAVEMGVAAAVGVAAGLLLAPKSGQEMRVNLKNKCCKNCCNIKHMFHKKTETVKDSAAHAEQ
jgi:gas vesicle protein